jgi:Uma2 family endonuclease
VISREEWEEKERRQQDGPVPDIPLRVFSPQEYLTIEREAAYKSEYLNGFIYDRTGRNADHNLITVSLGAALHPRTTGKDYSAFAPGLRVAPASLSMIAYPDFSAVRRPHQLLGPHQDVLLNPFLIAEVYSPETETLDRGTKFEHYKQIETLEDYLLVSQSEPHIDLFHRFSDDQWMLTSARGLAASLYVPSTETVLLLSEVYEQVKFLSHGG